MRVLASSDTRIKAPALAELLCTTQGYVPQVVGPLVKAGWVRSDTGPTGGYALAVPLETVSVLDVIEAVDGPTDSGRCVVADDPCDPAHPCVLHDAWTRARRELLRSLDTTPVVSITDSPIDTPTHSPGERQPT
jgi:Rrf2 family protein